MHPSSRSHVALRCAPQEEGFDIDPVELQPIIANAWHQLTTEERAGYDARAAQETLSYSATAQMYVQLFHEYETLAGEPACKQFTRLLAASGLRTVAQGSPVPGRNGPGDAECGSDGRFASCFSSPMCTPCVRICPAAQVGTAVDGMLLPKAMSGLLAAVRTQSQQRLVGGPTSRPTGRLPPAGSGTGMAGGAMASAFGPASRMAGGVGGGGAGFGGGAVPGGASAGRGAKRPLDALVGASALMGMTKGSGKGVVSGEDDDDDEDYETEGTKRRRMPSVPSGGGGAGGGAAGGGSWSLQRPPPRNTRLPAEKLPTCIADLPQQVRRGQRGTHCLSLYHGGHMAGGICDSVDRRCGGIGTGTSASAPSSPLHHGQTPRLGATVHGKSGHARAHVGRNRRCWHSDDLSAGRVLL